MKLDLVRKKNIENIINSSKNILIEKSDDLDLIYNYNLSIISFNEKISSEINLEVIRSRDDFINFKNILNQKKINYIYKNEEILDISKVSNIIRLNIKNNKKIFLENRNGYITLYSLIKDIESYEGIFVKLINIKSKKIIEDKLLNCKDIKKFDNITAFKEYKYSELNKSIKKDLKSINDYILYTEADIFNYIFLCELRFDKDLLNDININKKINNLAKDIQIKFLNKYKKKYNLKLL